MNSKKHLPLRARLGRLASDYCALNFANPDIESAIAALRLHAAVQEWTASAASLERVALDKPKCEICHKMLTNLRHLLSLQRRSGVPEQAAEAVSLEVFVTDRFTASAPAPALDAEVANA